MILDCLVEKCGKKYLWKYDNINGIIYDENLEKMGEKLLKFENGKRVSFPLVFDESPKYTKEKSNFKQKTKVTKFAIILGQKCNFHCNYCTEKSIPVNGHNATPKDVDIFIDYCIKYNIDPDVIELWGGEPLVYWKTVKKLIPKLRKIYPNQKIIIRTNGSLLDDDKIDFFYENKIILAISDDIDNRNRGKRAENNAKRMYKKYNEWFKKMGNFMSICTVINPLTCDTFEVLQKCKEYFPNSPKKSFFFNLLRVGYGYNPKEFKFKFSDDDLLTLFHSTFKRLVYDKSNIQGDYAYVANVFQFLKFHTIRKNKEIVSKHGKYIDGWCDAPSGDRLQMDLQGNIFSCKLTNDMSTCVGHVSEIDKIEYKGFVSSLSRRYCPSCPILGICRGICGLMDDENLEETCRQRYAYFYTYFKIGFETFTGAKLIAVKTEVPTAKLINFVEPNLNYKQKKIISINPI